MIHCVKIRNDDRNWVSRNSYGNVQIWGDGGGGGPPPTPPKRRGRIPPNLGATLAIPGEPGLSFDYILNRVYRNFVPIVEKITFLILVSGDEESYHVFD